jgi:hypothetical protein
MEVVRKYNQELKLLKNKDNEQIYNSNAISNTNNKIATTSSYTQTNMDESNASKNSKLEKTNEISSKDLSIFKKELIDIKHILNNNQNENSYNNETNLDFVDIYTLFSEIGSSAKSQLKNLNSLKLDLKTFREQNLKINNEVKFLKEAKSKLETLYKIKCKSDLNKSAQIKKLELNYEIELSKLRNEYNYDIVAYLKNKLSFKESLILDNFHQLNNLLDLIRNCTCTTSEFLTSNIGYEQNNLNNALSKIKKIVENLLNSLDKKQNESIIFNSLKNDDLNLNLNNIYKTVPVNLVCNNISDQKYNNKFKTQDAIEHSVCIFLKFKT